MNILQKYVLNYLPTVEYFTDRIKGANTLSDVLFDYVNFKNGLFFTILPAGIQQERIHQFEVGGIVSECSKNENKLKNTQNSDSEILNEVKNIIFDQIEYGPSISCIFDDVCKTPSSPFLESFRSKQGLLIYSEEIYYHINKKNLSRGFILECIEDSNALWHSLGILTSAEVDEKENLSLEKMKEICIKAKLIISSAYDSEGYIFWEPQALSS